METPALPAHRANSRSYGTSSTSNRVIYIAVLAFWLWVDLGIDLGLQSPRLVCGGVAKSQARSGTRVKLCKLSDTARLCYDGDVG